MSGIPVGQQAVVGAALDVGKGVSTDLLLKSISALLAGGAAAATGPAGLLAIVLLSGVGGIGLNALQALGQTKQARELAEQMRAAAGDRGRIVDLLHELIEVGRGETIEGIDREIEAALDARSGGLSGETVERCGGVLRELDLDSVEKITTIDSNTKLALKKLDDLDAKLDRGFGGTHEKLDVLVDRVAPAKRGLPKHNFSSAAVSRNPDFVDRPEQLDAMAAALARGGTVVLTHALCGEGGVGKTELAVEFAYRHAADFDGRWWINASHQTLEPSLAALVADLGEPAGPGVGPDDIRRSIYRLLGTGRHLVVLDNIDSAEALRTLSFPESCRVLVTTRLNDLLPGRQIDVPVLTREQSRELLTKHRADLRSDAHVAALDAVADELGDHALAVRLAAAYMRKTKVSPGVLLERLKRAEVGDPEHPLEGRVVDTEAGRYGMKIAASLSLLFEQLACEASLPVLAACSLVAPESIPVELIGDVLTFDAEAIDQALSELDTLSIVDLELDDQGRREVSIHRLTQSVVRSRTGQSSLEKLRGALTAALLGRLNDMTNYQRWGEHDRFVSHAEAVTTATVGADWAFEASTSESIIVLLGRVATAHQNRLRFAEAIEWYMRAEHGGRIALGDQEPALAVILSNYGYLLRMLGQLDESLAKRRDAERISRAAFGDDHPTVAISVNNIGSVLQDKGDLEGALEAYREAERIDRAAFGDHHPNVAIRMNNIGTVLRTKGDYESALAAYREAERIDRASFGDDHPEVATDVNNIGGVLQSLGDLDGALEAYRDAERIDRAAFGSDHPKVANRINNIGSVLESQGDLKGALAAYRDGERIHRRAFGDEHPRVAASVNNIGGVLQSLGDLEGALAAYRNAERIDRAAYGNEHPEVARDLNNIGSVCFSRGDRSGAAEYMERAFRILFTTYGPRGQNVVPAAFNLMSVKVSPLPIAEELAGPEGAAELRAACLEEIARRQGDSPDAP